MRKTGVGHEIRSQILEESKSWDNPEEYVAVVTKELDFIETWLKFDGQLNEKEVLTLDYPGLLETVYNDMAGNE